MRFWRSTKAAVGFHFFSHQKAIMKSSLKQNRLPSVNLLVLFPGSFVRKVAAAALVLVAGAAQAQLSLTGGYPTTFSGYSAEDILATGPVSTGIVGSTIFADEVGRFEATFLGKETDDLTSFTIGNLTTLRIDSTDPALTTISSNVVPGLLTFAFRDMTDGESVTNGHNDNQALANFVVFGTTLNGVFTPDTANGAYTYILGFNDGATGNADYDDLVVGLNFSTVPEPETCALMFAGLGALVFRSRQRRSADKM